MYLSGFGRHKPWDGTREEGLRLPSSFQLFPPTQAGPGSQALSSGHAPVGGRGEGPSIGVGQGQGSLCFPSSSAWHTICPGRTNLTRSRHSSPSEPNPSPSAPPRRLSLRLPSAPSTCCFSILSSSPSSLNSSWLSPSVPPLPGTILGSLILVPRVSQGHSLDPWLFTWQMSVSACRMPQLHRMLGRQRGARHSPDPPGTPSLEGKM